MKKIQFQQLLDEGAFFLRFGQVAEARACFKRAQDLKLRHAPSLLELAKYFCRLGDQGAADAIIERAIAIGKMEPFFQLTLAQFYMQLEKFQEAISILDDLIKRPDTNGDIQIVAALNRASSLKNYGNLPAAINQYRLIEKKSLGKLEFHYNFANALLQGGYVNEAVENYNLALKIDNTNNAIVQNLAEAYSIQGDLRSAEIHFYRLIEMKSDNHEARHGLSFVQLKSGDFNHGWANYRSRWFDPIFIGKEKNQAARFIRLFKYPVDASSLNNKSVAIIGEQGIGDVIMFISILPDLIALGARITLYANIRLSSLIKNSFPEIKFYPVDSVFSHANNFDYLMPVGDLPAYFRTERIKFPGSLYLRPSKKAIEFIGQHYVLDKKKFNIGLAWRGGSPGTASTYRTLELNTLAQCFTVAPIKLYSLQYNENKIDLLEFNSTGGQPISPFLDQELDDLDNLAALVSQLDLIVTVQNTNVHLSGALGKACIALLPFSPEWRYGIEEDSMAWYASVKLVRQTKLGQWDDVIAKANTLINQAFAEWKGRV